MNATIDVIPLGFDQCYLLRGEGPIVAIDAGMPGHGRTFAKAIERLGIAPRDIGLIVITHGHWDHIGSAKALKEMTGAALAMHGLERYRLERGYAAMPKGATPWGHAFGALLGLTMLTVRIPPTKVDLYLDAGGLNLEDWGIAGRVVHTPGHSPGSVSVVLESGEAFVGDQAMNGLPLRREPGLPIFAEEPDLVRETWHRFIAEQDVTTIYPAHGDAFDVSVMKQALC